MKEHELKYWFNIIETNETENKTEFFQTQLHWFLSIFYLKLLLLFLLSFVLHLSSFGQRLIFSLSLWNRLEINLTQLNK